MNARISNNSTGSASTTPDKSEIFIKELTFSVTSIEAISESPPIGAARYSAIF
jgi:hypothetical protein